jgi:hypothetical protein
MTTILLLFEIIPGTWESNSVVRDDKLIPFCMFVFCLLTTHDSIFMLFRTIRNSQNNFLPFSIIWDVEQFHIKHSDIMCAI